MATAAAADKDFSATDFMLFSSLLNSASDC
jgi:hypothetical protein